MPKIKRFSRYQQELPLINIQDKIQLLYKRFDASDLGKMYKALPVEEIVKKFKLKQNRKGRDATFTPAGKIRLEFLKCYTGFSDKRLAEEIISNINYQIFCDVSIPLETIKIDYKLISKIRVELSKKINRKEIQQILFKKWSPYIKNKDICLLDATCYESYISQPSNVKLLFRSVCWMDTSIENSSKSSNLKRCRYKREVLRVYKLYSKKRQKRIKETKKITRRLLYILKKLLLEHRDLIKFGIYKKAITNRKSSRISTITKILDQQYKIFGGEKVKDKILSIEKDYIHTIIRGKEKKPYEYGAKVHMLQIDGLNFIEDLNFSANNECTRMLSSLSYHKNLTGKKPKFIAGDRIYATNRNRKITKKLGISTNFIPKGKKSKNEKEMKILRQELNKERNTRLEGSFGTEKEYYGDKRIKARTKLTEEYQILVKIHCRNLLLIGKRMSKSPPESISIAC